MSEQIVENIDGTAETLPDINGADAENIIEAVLFAEDSFT